MKYAIVVSGGKQYKAIPGETLRVDRLPQEVEEQVVLDEVLLVAEENQLAIGEPLVKGAAVKTTVTGQIKGPKIRVFKYKPKVRYRKTQGHRQHYTLLRVDEIVTE
jgi:large subunit ribosomal protein L21